jgi:hypothetical protein
MYIKEPQIKGLSGHISSALHATATPVTRTAAQENVFMLVIG